MGNKSSRKTNKSDPAVLTEDELNLLKTSTLYSEEEIQAWHTGFLKDCPSGQLDKKQFLQLYRVSLGSSRPIDLVHSQRFYPDGKPDKYCHFVFKAFDTDNNNWIDFTEFLFVDFD